MLVLEILRERYVQYDCVERACLLSRHQCRQQEDYHTRDDLRV